jgi:hypothetical protein
MKLIVLLMCAALLSASPALADYYSYAEWNELSDASRAAYIAGAFDVLTDYATTDDKAAPRYFRSCMSQAKLLNGQLAENVKAFAGTRPELQAGSVTGALLAYLTELCQVPPSRT